MEGQLAITVNQDQIVNNIKRNKRDKSSNSIFKIGEKVDLKANFYIDRQFTYKGSTNIKTFEDLKSEKILLLSDEAGSGKSTTFRYITEKLKKNIKLSWVQYVDLKQYVHILPKISKLSQNSTEITEFLAIKFFKFTGTIDSKMFKSFFKANKTILLWDGIDEISPTYSNVITNLINSIKSLTNNRQWLSTRPNVEHQIKRQLSTPVIVFEPLNETTRMEFITKFMEYEFLDQQNITKGIIAIEKFIEQLRKHQIVNNPLMLHMICKSYTRKFALSNSTNLYSFYENYVSELIDIIHEKGEIVKSDTKKIEEEEMFRKTHQSTAISMIYQNYTSDWSLEKRTYLHKLGIIKYTSHGVNEEIFRYGLLYRNQFNQIEFQHRTFAEFFIAQYLYLNIYSPLNESPRDEEADLRLRLLFFVLYSGDYNNFIKGFQEKNETNETPFNEVIANLLSYRLKNEVQMLLTYYVDAEFLNDFFKKDYEVIKKIWDLDKNTTLVHQLNYISPTFIYQKKHYMKIIRNTFKPDDANRIIEGKYQTVNKMYEAWWCPNVNLSDSCGFNRDIYDPNFIKTINSNYLVNDYREFVINFSFYVTKQNSLTEKIIFIWDVVRSNIDKKTMKEVLFYKDVRGNLTTACSVLQTKNENVTEYFLSLIPSYLNDDEIFDLLMQRDLYDEETCITFGLSRLNFNITKKIWNFVEERFDKNKQRQLFTSFGPFPGPIRVFLSVNLQGILFYKKIIKNLFSNAELCEMLFQIKGDNETILNKLSSFFTFAKLQFEKATELIEFIEETLENDIEKIKEFLLIRNIFDQKTFYQLADIHNKPLREGINPLEKLVNKYFTDEEIQLYLS